MHPEIFSPTDFEPFDVNAQTLQIPKCTVQFEKWTGMPITNTWGGKGLVKVDNKPMFAELAIMTHFALNGWNARWVETYGFPKMQPVYLTEWKDNEYNKYKNQVHQPFANDYIDNLLAGIAKLNGNSYWGCWDVVAYKDDKVVFAEAKRTKKDSVRATQTKWLDAAIRYGLQPNDFLVVQWDFN